MSTSTTTAAAAAATKDAATARANKKRKLSTQWLPGGYEKAATDKALAETEAKLSETKAELARAHRAAKAAAGVHAEEVAALKAKFDQVHRLAARYQRERDAARVERDAARAERDDVAQERDDGAKEAAETLKRSEAAMASCNASAKEAAAQAAQKRLALAKQIEELTKKHFNAKVAFHGADKNVIALRLKNAKLQVQLDRVKTSLAETKEVLRLKETALAEALEQSKTARELGRREAAADAAAAKARVENTVDSLQAALTKSKSLQDEVESLRAQRDTAKKRLARVAGFQRQQMQMQQMLMSQRFLNLEDDAGSSASSAASAASAAGEPRQEQQVEMVD